MKFNRLIRKTALLACLLAVAPVPSQGTWESISVDARSLTEEALSLPAVWGSGVLRVALTPPVEAWRLVLDYGRAGRLVFDSASAGARIVRRESGRIVLDLPVLPNTTLTATAEPSNLKVYPLRAFKPRNVYGEQLIPDSKVNSVAPNSAEALRPGAAFARAELLSQSGALIGVCTAFRIAKGYWLTAAHCAYRLAGQAPTESIASLRLQTDVFAGQVETLPALRARVVASGLGTSSLATNSFRQNDDLDYALLEAEGDTGEDLIDLGDARLAIANTPLILYQHWTGELPPAAGKAYADGESCVVQERLDFPDASKPALCAIQHGCSSQTGASGSPILKRDSLELVGLHYGEGLRSKFNCGLTAATIKNDLCARAPMVARKAIKCP